MKQQPKESFMSCSRCGKPMGILQIKCASCGCVSWISLILFALIGTPIVVGLPLAIIGAIIEKFGVVTAIVFTVICGCLIYVAVRSRRKQSGSRFLAVLNNKEKAVVSSLNPLVYAEIIMEKKGEDVRITTDDETTINLVRRLDIIANKPFSPSVRGELVEPCIGIALRQAQGERQIVIRDNVYCLSVTSKYYLNPFRLLNRVTSPRIEEISQVLPNTIGEHLN